ncbi:cytochrome P450 [Streptomyces lancefieldiae]|uniref:Cytochrome P450 n=1 Tax=Streptomyces lancefieldiae TaxID=3075520 RepID=A0ABU3AJK5_9ACTN|nr:cytochrome P450 [Streptomyces sp. DSM 40712]MDT0609253.1 cytochrome P450 [Streptomyces sp. DSM 40712]
MVREGQESARKADRGRARPACPVGRAADGTWQVHDYAVARELLRGPGTVQAGLGIETVEKLPPRVRRPVLYRDGPEHREHRRQTARFFTPRRVDEHYRALMVRIAEEQLAALRAAGEAHLSDLAFDLAIGVVSDVIGLRYSRPGLRRRLERFFPEEFGQPGLTSVRGLYWLVRQNTNWLRIHLADVRPAIRAHRRRPHDDLISHLVAEGCSDAEILGECLTFAAAGMVTTREFISLAAWHLFSDTELLAHYRSADEAGRLATLQELLRLEPVIGQLRRRATRSVELAGPDGPVTVRPGEYVELLLDDANTDPKAVGEDPLLVRPGRAADVGAGLSFGDGPHRCPGAHIALLETDVFLSRLFALDGIRMNGEPRVAFQKAIGGYEIRGLTVALPRAGRR